MSVKQFTLSWDQVDEIVIQELKDALEMNLCSNKDEGGYEIPSDEETVEAIKKVLEYFMPSIEYQTYISSLIVH